MTRLLLLAFLFSCALFLAWAVREIGDSTLHQLADRMSGSSRMP